ncbi:MAG TPA: MBL fold metallo-hydrolase [Thermomonospora sp.]|nr:MBL fold metallo-hydrolase [Thermomonospora sp.]
MSDAAGGVRHPERLEERHPFRQWKTWRIPGAELTLTGYSRANDKTFFHVPELRCALDAGLAEGRRVETVFLTHTHLDHSKDLDFLAVADTGVDVYVPAEALPYVESYLRATTELNHGRVSTRRGRAPGRGCTACGRVRSSPSAGAATACGSWAAVTRCRVSGTASPRPGPF